MDEFVAMCGLPGLSRLFSEGRADLPGELHAHRPHPRSRVQEGVAMALQPVGDADLEMLLAAQRAGCAV